MYTYAIASARNVSRKWYASVAVRIGGRFLQKIEATHQLERYTLSKPIPDSLENPSVVACQTRQPLTDRLLIGWNLSSNRGLNLLRVTCRTGKSPQVYFRCTLNHRTMECFVVAIRSQIFNDFCHCKFTACIFGSIWHRECSIGPLFFSFFFFWVVRGGSIERVNPSCMVAVESNFNYLVFKFQITRGAVDELRISPAIVVRSLNRKQ